MGNLPTSAKEEYWTPEAATTPTAANGMVALPTTPTVVVGT